MHALHRGAQPLPSASGTDSLTEAPTVTGASAPTTPAPPATFDVRPHWCGGSLRWEIYERGGGKIAELVDTTEAVAKRITSLLELARPASNAAIAGMAASRRRGLEALSELREGSA